MEYFIFAIAVVGVYALAAIWLNLLVGFTGLLSAGHAVFFGVGAYVAGIMAAQFSSDLGVVLLVAVLISAAISVPTENLLTSLDNDEFALGTLGINIAFLAVLRGIKSVTGGSAGLSGISAPTVAGSGLSLNGVATAVWILVGVSVLMIWALARSHLGLALRGIRADPMLARSTGREVRTFRRWTFVASGVGCGAAGAFYAGIVGYLEPADFDVMQSILLLAIVVIGGSGSVVGPIVGAAVIAGVPEVLRFWHISGPEIAYYRQLLFGLLLIAFVLARPRGLIGSYAFRKRDA